MIAPKVPSESEIFDILRGLDFEPTDAKTATGTFWRHAPSGKHLQVPFSVQGYYPDWLRSQFLSRAYEIALGIDDLTPAGRVALAADTNDGS